MSEKIRDVVNGSAFVTANTKYTYTLVNIENDTVAQNWLATYGINTKVLYTSSYRHFIRFLNTKHSREDSLSWNGKLIIAVRELDLKSEDKTKKCRWEDWLKEFATDYLRGERGLSDGSVKNICAGVVSFFKENGVPLQLVRKYTRAILGEQKIVKQRYDLELSQVEKLIDKVSQKYKVILHVMRCTGFRVGDVIKLKQSSFLNIREKEAPYFLGKVYTKKGKLYAIPFIDEECKKWTDNWLETLESKGLKGAEREMFPCSEYGVTVTTNMIKKAAKEANIIPPEGYIIGAHCFRKFLFNSLIMAGVQEVYAKMIIGKKVNEKMYLTEKLRNEYKKVLPLIWEQPVSKELITNYEQAVEKISRLETSLDKQDKDIVSLKVENRQTIVKSFVTEMTTMIELSKNLWNELEQREPKFIGIRASMERKLEEYIKTHNLPISTLDMTEEQLSNMFEETKRIAKETVDENK